MIIETVVTQENNTSEKENGSGNVGMAALISSTAYHGFHRLKGFYKECMIAQLELQKHIFYFYNLSRL